MESSSLCQDVSLTVCICTSGRPQELERCLESIANGTQLPIEVIVSDDSREKINAHRIEGVCNLYPFVRYVEGPQRGLCPNRNHAICQSRTSHVSLIDDDGVVGNDFIRLAMVAIGKYPLKIISGDVLESGKILTPPTNSTRWGHFGAALQPGELLRNVNLNCNVFPRAAFVDAAFDELLVYGYEDTDLCDRLIQSGWEIKHHPELVNQHLPPTRGDGRPWMAERERFVVLFRLRSAGYFGRLGMIPWIPLSGLHALVAYTRRRKWGWVVRIPVWITRGVCLALRQPIPLNLPMTSPQKMNRTRC